MSDRQQTHRTQSRTTGGAHEAVDAPAPREPVTLVKGTHRWTFACDAGDESSLLKRLSELASDQSVPFDWFDAALVSHQLSKRLKPGLQRIEGGTPSPKPGIKGK